MENKIKELEKAKENVKWLLENDGSADMHGIAYWAERVEILREEIKKVI
ncbi:MAG: hypothetical protein PHD31_02685 [Candidatus Pacebacteria bacterium]|nr:hypothetical protein [Candidatus Paceibacterota bacterium]